MTVYSYIRVSTKRQAVNGLSAETQARIIESFLSREGAVVAAAFSDLGVSGTKPLRLRPDGAAMLSKAKRGDVLVSSHLDRMFRNSTDALVMFDELSAAGVDLRFLDIPGSMLTGGSAWRYAATMQAAAAHMQASAVSARTKAGFDELRARGKRTGGRTPLGMTLDRERKELTGQDQQRRLVARMADLKASGLSLRQIADTLTAEGVKVSFATVRRYLDRATILQAEGAEA